MNKLIFINLFIDNEWDTEKVIDSVYSIRLNSSTEILNSYQSWAVYEGDIDDYALVMQKLDSSFRIYLSKMISLSTEVLASDLSLELLNKIEEVEFVGISGFEKGLLASLPNVQSKYFTEEEYRAINSKEVLVKIASDNKINFPKTNVISLKEFHQLESKDKPFVLKFLNSAGGRGVFIVTDKTSSLPSFIERQLEDFSKDLGFLEQEFIPIRSHFYTLGHTNFSAKDVVGFEITYDKNNNSKKHIFERSIASERVEAAQKIANYLSSKGYDGAFGFDGLYSEAGVLYPAIDLNVRLDKARMIYNLSKKLSLENKYLEFRRERYLGKPFRDFDQFWNKRQVELQKINSRYNDNFAIIPILFSNFFSQSLESNMVEISFFLVSNVEERLKMDEWIDEVYNWIGIE